jgi:hypothetical protein
VLFAIVQNRSRSSAYDPSSRLLLFCILVLTVVSAAQGASMGKSSPQIAFFALFMFGPASLSM